AELVKRAPDVIVVPSAGIAGMMRQETTTIPIVVLVAGDLVGPGLVESLARPGKNVTGTQIVQPDLMGKRLQLLKDILRTPTRVALLRETVSAIQSRSYWSDIYKEFEAHARGLGMEAMFHEVSRPDELEDRFKTMLAQRVAAVIVWGSPFTF